MRCGGLYRPYSLGKQIQVLVLGPVGLERCPPSEFRFGRGQEDHGAAGFRQPRRIAAEPRALFGVCNIFAMAGFSLGALVFFAKRLFAFQAPDIVQIFVNYIGASESSTRNARASMAAFSTPMQTRRARRSAGA